VAGPQPQRPDAFVSYSRRDGEFVQRLVAALAANGKDLWVDLEDIPKSADWRARIEAGIESAKAVVVVVSPSFVSSHVCGEDAPRAAAQQAARAGAAGGGRPRRPPSRAGGAELDHCG